MSQENVEIVRRLFEQWATGDLRADCFDPGVEHLRTGAMTPDMEGRWVGLDEMSTALRQYLRAFSDLRIEAERIVDLSGDRVLVLSRHTARGKQSGIPIEHEIGDLFTMRNGRIVRYESYWDPRRSPQPPCRSSRLGRRAARALQGSRTGAAGWGRWAPAGQRVPSRDPVSLGPQHRCVERQLLRRDEAGL